MPPRRGTLVISLDFEIHWGVRDHAPPTGPYAPNLLGVRRAIPAILDRFRHHEIAATWATVGMLFARSREELAAFSPPIRPTYADPRLDPYAEPLGADEATDPLHFAPSLIDAIAATPGQELATHTFSHFYCLDPGATRDAFAADLTSAVAIAAARGMALRSIVFPRNQRNPAFDGVLRDVGIVAYRGNPRARMYAGAATETHGRRVARLVDTYLPITGDNTYDPSYVASGDGLHDVPASFFVRPWSRRLAPLDGARLRRIGDSMKRAARDGRIVHLWWHPHNFGANTAQNLEFLERILAVYRACRDQYGMRSTTMGDVATSAG